MKKILLISYDHRIYQGKFLEASSLKEAKSRILDLGLNIRGPIGNIDPHFIFLLESPIEGESDDSDFKHPEWIPLNKVISKNEEIYKAYVDMMFAGYQPPTKVFDVFYFGAGAVMAGRLAHLITKGKKRGTAGWSKVYDALKIPLPVMGGVSLITDGHGLPLCFIRTVNVQQVKFRDVTDEMARLEGEGDLSLADWKDEHWNFFTKFNVPLIGIPFTEDEIIYFETFELLKVLGN